jgi:hypothetical protein
VADIMVELEGNHDISHFQKEKENIQDKVKFGFFLKF